jgi:hypothetical protein
MKNEEVSLDLSVETIALLARTDATANRRTEDPLDLEGRSATTISIPLCCP